MPGIPFSRLVDEFVATLERSSATVIRERETDPERPARLRVITSEGTTDCILFLWAVTPGGRNRPENEMRIQATGLRGIPLQPGVRTLLGGWNAEHGVYVFWDPRRHTRFRSRSNSLQVNRQTLETAFHAGIATYLRPTEMGREVVVAVQPDSLLWYVERGLPLHNSEEDSSAVADLADAAYDDERNFLDESEDEIQAARRYDLVQTMRAYREAQFRPKVLRAYRYCCAVCGTALKLVDAAHIVPVSDPQSTDDVTNGLALCRLHHGAYDNGLLGVQSSYKIVVNPDKASQLVVLQLDMGLDEFRGRLPEHIALPNVIDARPNPEYLALGLRSRQWPTAYIS